MILFLLVFAMENIYNLMRQVKTESVIIRV